MHRLSRMLVCLLRPRQVAVAVAALAVSVPIAHAEQVAIKYAYGSFSPSPAALAAAKPMKQPLLSLKQMKSMGILTADGTLAQPPRASKAKSQIAKMLTAANAGGPALEPFQVIPKMSSPAPSPGGSSGLSSQMSGGTDGVAPMNYGSDFEWPFTTMRVELGNKSVNTKAYPYRAVGKLFVFAPDGYPIGHCSASMIAKGVLVTAAHCVADYGIGFMNANWVFYAGFYNGKAVAKASARAVIAPQSYLDGTDCIDSSPVCLNDVALIVLADTRGRYIGTKTGWLSAGYDGFGYNSVGQAQITQLGYPGGIDYGNQMIRNDSLGEIWDASFAYNTLLGSQMNGGSSGGPWVQNFGIPPVTNGVFPGYAPRPNVVVGVTSWGSPSTPLAVMGASPFTSGNILSLYSAACSAFPAACAP